VNLFQHDKQWAADNKMIINITKTKEIVFQRPSWKHFLASALCRIEQVTVTNYYKAIGSYL